MNKHLFIILILIVSVVPCVSRPANYDKEIKEYKKQIDNKAVELEKIEKELENKKTEKDKIRYEEESIRKQLSIYKVQLNKVSKEIINIESEIRITKIKLKDAMQTLKLAAMEIEQLKDIIARNLNYIYQNNYAIRVINADPWIEKLESCLINEKVEFMLKAEKRKQYSQEAQEKYTRVQKELNALYAQLDVKQKQQSGIYLQQKELFKTTQGKRIGLEDEIKQLNKTAEEVQGLIGNLEQQKQKTVEMKQQEEISRKQFKEKKKFLPWPVSGTVCSQFGKTKHAELDTYIISNGIKIKSGPNTDVLAVDKGEVVYASVFRSYGKTVIIDHGGSVYTIYGNLSEILVNTNKKISSEGVLGKTGNDGILYFEIRIDNNPENPVNWLK